MSSRTWPKMGAWSRPIVMFSLYCESQDQCLSERKGTIVRRDGEGVSPTRLWAVGLADEQGGYRVRTKDGWALPADEETPYDVVCSLCGGQVRRRKVE